MSNENVTMQVVPVPGRDTDANESARVFLRKQEVDDQQPVRTRAPVDVKTSENGRAIFKDKNNILLRLRANGTRTGAGPRRPGYQAGRSPGEAPRPMRPRLPNNGVRIQTIPVKSINGQTSYINPTESSETQNDKLNINRFSLGSFVKPTEETLEPTILTERNLTSHFNGTNLGHKVLVGHRKIHLHGANVLSKNMSVIIGHVSENSFLEKLIMENLKKPTDRALHLDGTENDPSLMKTIKESQESYEIGESSSEPSLLATMHPQHTLVASATDSQEFSESSFQVPPSSNQRHITKVKPSGSSSSTISDESISSKRVSHPSPEELESQDREAPDPEESHLLEGQNLLPKSRNETVGKPALTLNRLPHRGKFQRRPHNLHPTSNHTRPVLKPPHHFSRNPLIRRNNTGRQNIPVHQGSPDNDISRQDHSRTPKLIVQNGNVTPVRPSLQLYDQINPTIAIHRDTNAGVLVEEKSSKGSTSQDLESTDMISPDKTPTNGRDSVDVIDQELKVSDRDSSTERLSPRPYAQPETSHAHQNGLNSNLRSSTLKGRIGTNIRPSSRPYSQIIPTSTTDNNGSKSWNQGFKAGVPTGKESNLELSVDATTTDKSLVKHYDTFLVVGENPSIRFPSKSYSSTILTGPGKHSPEETTANQEPGVSLEAEMSEIKPDNMLKEVGESLKTHLKTSRVNGTVKLTLPHHHFKAVSGRADPNSFIPNNRPLVVQRRRNGTHTRPPTRQTSISSSINANLSKEPDTNQRFRTNNKSSHFVNGVSKNTINGQTLVHQQVDPTTSSQDDLQKNPKTNIQHGTDPNQDHLVTILPESSSIKPDGVGGIAEQGLGGQTRRDHTEDYKRKDLISDIKDPQSGEPTKPDKASSETSEDGINYFGVKNVTSKGFMVIWVAPQGIFTSFVLSITPKSDQAKDDRSQEKGSSDENTSNVLDSELDSKNLPNAGVIKRVLPDSTRSYPVTDLAPQTGYHLSFFGRSPGFRSDIHTIIISTGT